MFALPTVNNGAHAPPIPPENSEHQLPNGSSTQGYKRAVFNRR